MQQTNEPPARASDEDLLELAGGDPEAFAEFYRRNVGWLLRVCARRTRDPELAADLTSEVFAAALLAASRYRRDRAGARTWLLGIFVHKAANMDRRGRAERRARRRLRLERHALTTTDVESFAALLEPRSDDASVLRLLGDLAPDVAQAVEARVVRGHSYARVAAALGITEAAARQRVSRGLRQLRAQIGALDG